MIRECLLIMSLCWVPKPQHLGPDKFDHQQTRTLPSGMFCPGERLLEPVRASLLGILFWDTAIESAGVVESRSWKRESSEQKPRGSMSKHKARDKEKHLEVIVGISCSKANTKYRKSWIMRMAELQVWEAGNTCYWRMRRSLGQPLE